MPQRRLSRLAALAGTDEGFYVLALHSFVEAYVMERNPAARLEALPFGELVESLGNTLRAQRRIDEDTRRVFVRIAREHALTHRVRHDFVELDKEIASAATHNFVRFCKACGISDPALPALEQSLALWDEKRSPLERSDQLQRLQLQLTLLQREKDKAVQQLGAYTADRERLAGLDREMAVLRSELEQERGRAQDKSARFDKARKDLNDLRLERAQLAEKLQQYESLERYIEYLDQFSLYTRTRRDYEKSVLRLAPEQSAVLDAIDLGRPFLIKGGAGTGKTLVLLQALAKARSAQSAELGLQDRGRIVLLTYTNTLAKYDRYLAEIMGPEAGGDGIVTADSYLAGKLRQALPNARVDYDVVEPLCRAHNTTGFLTDDELVTEIEEMLFGNRVTREEYVDNRMLRRGMRQPLSATQRAQVWELRDRVAAEMESQGRLSKNYARIKLIEHLEGGAAGLADADFVFLDEAQDLSAVDLWALRLLARRALIMAGDTDQSIYGVGSPYARAGLEIAGRTRILHTNYRNTCAIHELAEAYRRRAGQGRYDDSTVPKAFREGPVPELYLASSGEQLRELLLGKLEVFVRHLGYDPENITILAPTHNHLRSLAEALKRLGFESANIRDDDFSFAAERTIRLSTLHSSKGLDFAVVLLYLPHLPRADQYEERSADKLMRNLIYVAMTRAMDNLNVFTMENPQEPALVDLIATFREREAAE